MSTWFDPADLVIVYGSSEPTKDVDPKTNDKNTAEESSANETEAEKRE